MRFLNLTNRYCAFVGGFGSGKTHVLALGIVLSMWSSPKILTAYYAPTLRVVRDVFYEKIQMVSELLNLTAVIKVGNYEVDFYNGRQWRGKCICRSMENPQNIVGIEAGRIAIDELDILNVDKATVAWNKIVARARAKGTTNRVDVGTTPEGYRFTYRRFVLNPENGEYGIVHASTYDNERNLPERYIDSLINTYPEYLIRAYINGEFTNLTSGTVYRSYNRDVHNSEEEIRNGDSLYIGQDFNVGNMCGVVLVQRHDGYHAVDQIVNVLDTPQLCDVLRRKYHGFRVLIFPDASAGARKTNNASKTDINLLREAGFQVLSSAANPSVRDRVVSVNKAFESGKLHINTRRCPDVVDCLEKQAYNNNGEPDKTTGFDHINDALGYMVIKKIPGGRRTLVGGIR